jgi:hypothetical protein
MASGLSTPVTLTVASRAANSFSLRADGSAALTFSLPGPLDVHEPHGIKLLYLWGSPDILLCQSALIHAQGLNTTTSPVLGISGTDSNVFHPIPANSHIPTANTLILRNLDGTPMRLPLPEIVLALHLVPQEQMHLWA